MRPRLLPYPSPFFCGEGRPSEAEAGVGVSCGSTPPDTSFRCVHDAPPQSELRSSRPHEGEGEERKSAPDDVARLDHQRRMGGAQRYPSRRRVSNGRGFSERPKRWVSLSLHPSYRLERPVGPGDDDRDRGGSWRVGWVERSDTHHVVASLTRRDIFARSSRATAPESRRPPREAPHSHQTRFPVVKMPC
jgi:hypothetical protein